MEDDCSRRYHPGRRFAWHCDAPPISLWTIQLFSTIPLLSRSWARLTRKSFAERLPAWTSLFRSACAHFSSLAAATRKSACYARSKREFANTFCSERGLDTFAYRNPYLELHVFEVDHPATQQWKRDLLGSGAIPIPANLTYVPVDFERKSLPNELLANGFDPAQPTFFAWLGVVPYLTLPRISRDSKFRRRAAQRQRDRSRLWPAPLRSAIFRTTRA